MIRVIGKRSLLSAACLCLAWFGAGCGTSSVNEAGSTGATASAATEAPPKDAPPPPKSVKEYYERSQSANPPAKGATKKGGKQ